MIISRHFLLAPSLARLIQKERGGERVSEGYFPGPPERLACVELDGRGGRLILVTEAADGPREERAEVPLAHAAALLDVTAAVVEYFRIELVVDGWPVQVRRLVHPGLLDLAAVAFEDAAAARAFEPPPWFGPEVTAAPRYRSRTVAVSGVPDPVEVALSDAMLASLLDTLESRAVRAGGAAARPPVRSSAGAPVGGPVRPAPASQEAALEEATIEDVEESLIRELARSLRPQRS